MPKRFPVTRFPIPVVVVAVMLIAAACATRSDRVTILPPVPTALVPNAPNDVGTGRCTFTIGHGQGALVSEVLPTGPAAGVLAVDDVVTDFDGATVRTSADLVAAVRASSIGQTVTLAGERDGSPFSVEVTLGESGEVAGRPVLGVLVSTFEDRREPEELEEQPIATPLARVVSVGGELWVLDPAGITWSPLGVATPEGALIASDGEVYTVEVSAVGAADLIGAVSGRRVSIDIANWTAVSVIGTLGDKPLLGAERTDPAGGVTEYAIIAVDPAAGEAIWFWSTDPAAAEPVPVAGYSNVTGDIVLLALSDAERTAAPLWVLLAEADDAATAQVATGIPDGVQMVGWHDAARLLAVTATIDQALLIDPVTGTAVETTLPVDSPAVRMWTVGDGAHVLIEGGDGLELATVGGIERRSLTASCEPAVVSEFGWFSG
jgi:PDZ domain